MPADRFINPRAFDAAEGSGTPAQSPVDPLAGPREEEQERSLRPKTLAEFVGQRRAVENLRIALSAARTRGEVLDHLLLSGPPGLGKTSLARILAQECGATLHGTTGPALERPRDLVGILTQLGRGDVLFIDEIHRVPTAVEEYLYTAMEDYSIDFTLDQGPAARILPLRLEQFTLVGATTREGLLSAPFRARFGLFQRLDPYPDADLVEILERAAALLDVKLAPGAAAIIATRARGTPRVANRFLRRVRDLAQVSGIEIVDRELANDALARLGVDDNGLEEMDRRILAFLACTPGEPVGLKTIGAAVGESEDTIEEVYEPHLLRSGFLRKTARGRVVTDAGCASIGLAADGTARDPESAS